MNKGIFIVLEGIDGAGKSSHMHTVEEYFKKHYHKRRVILTREPISSPFALDIVELIASYPELSKKTQAFLMNAARNMHITQTIRPALNHGDIVVCDRFTASTLAYQGLEPDILKINRLATKYTKPDLILWLDASAEIAHQRIQQRDEEDTDKTVETLRKLQLNYKKIFNHTDFYQKPNIRINADLSFAQVQQQIIEALDQFCEEHFKP